MGILKTLDGWFDSESKGVPSGPPAIVTSAAKPTVHLTEIDYQRAYARIASLAEQGFRYKKRELTFGDFIGSTLIKAERSAVWFRSLPDGALFYPHMFPAGPSRKVSAYCYVDIDTGYTSFIPDSDFVVYDFGLFMGDAE